CAACVFRQKDKQVLTPQRHSRLRRCERVNSTEKICGVLQIHGHALLLAALQQNRDLGHFHKSMPHSDMVDAWGKLPNIELLPWRNQWHLLGDDFQENHELVQHLIVSDVLEKGRRRALMRLGQKYGVTSHADRMAGQVRARGGRAGRSEKNGAGGGSVIVRWLHTAAPPPLQVVITVKSAKP